MPRSLGLLTRYQLLPRPIRGIDCIRRQWPQQRRSEALARPSRRRQANARGRAQEGEGVSGSVGATDACGRAGSAAAARESAVTRREQLAKAEAALRAESSRWPREAPGSACAHDEAVKRACRGCQGHRHSEGGGAAPGGGAPGEGGTCPAAADPRRKVLGTE